MIPTTIWGAGKAKFMFKNAAPKRSPISTRYKKHIEQEYRTHMRIIGIDML